MFLLLTVANDQYLLGYLISELLVKIDHYCPERRPGPMIGVIFELFEPVLGENQTKKVLDRFERSLRPDSNDPELSLGLRHGTLASSVAVGRKSFEDDHEVQEARKQAPLLAREKASLGPASLDEWAFLYLDKLYFTGHLQCLEPKQDEQPISGEERNAKAQADQEADEAEAEMLAELQRLSALKEKHMTPPPSASEESKDFDYFADDFENTEPKKDSS